MVKVFHAVSELEILTVYMNSEVFVLEIAFPHIAMAKDTLLYVVNEAAHAVKSSFHHLPFWNGYKRYTIMGQIWESEL